MIPSQWYLEVVWNQLQSDVTLVAGGAANGGGLIALEGLSVFTLRATHSGRLLHWCVIGPGQLVNRLEHLYQTASHLAVFVFYPSKGWASNVEGMLSSWLGQGYVAHMGDSRFLAISQCLTRGCLYWAGATLVQPQVSDAFQPMHVMIGHDDEDLAAAEAASLAFEEEERGRRRKSRGAMPPTLTKRLCMNRPCEKARTNQPLCVICRQNVASVVFLDCCHVSTCENCIREDWDKGLGSLACYTCRTPCVLGPASLYVSENCV